MRISGAFLFRRLGDRLLSPNILVRPINMHHHLPPLSGTVGAAFLLRAPAKTSATIEHDAGLVRLVSGEPCLTVALHAAVAPDAVRDACWRVAQEALDVRAATHREAYATRDGEHNFITWQAEADGYALSIIDTIQAPWQMHAEIVVHSAPGSHPPPPSPPPPPVEYHPALRYYRLSQLTDDLFDAFRNAYLALEYLISEVSPKSPGESEQNWLTRVLGGTLAPILPGGIDVVTFVESVYKFGRLPLFHAKSYATIYLPHGTERSTILNTFETLQQLLASIQHHRLNPRIASGWGQMSEQASDAMARTVYMANQVTFAYGLQRVRLDTDFEIIEIPRHFGSIWGRTPFLAAPQLTALERLDLLRDGADWVSMDLPSIVPLAGVSKIQIVLRQAQRNAKAPTKLHTS